MDTENTNFHTARAKTVSHGSSGHSVAAVYNPDRPENLNAYKQAFIERVASDCGFNVDRVLPASGRSHRPARLTNRI